MPLDRGCRCDSFNRLIADQVWLLMTIVAFGRRAAKIITEASVILRRQVPIRFDEPVRSWFGGLPQMQHTVAWPRAATNGAALNFIAQICCADLPKDIWGGRGPREGWLLLFADYRQLNDAEEDESLVQVLHINRLGPERHPPAAPFLRSILNRLTPSEDDDGHDANKPPATYRRWPLDIIKQTAPPPPPETEDDWWAPMPIALEEVYGAPVDQEAIGNLAQGEPRPRTWRAALTMVDELINTFDVREVPTVKRSEEGSDWWYEPEPFCRALNDLPKGIPSNWEPGWLEKIKAQAAASLAREVARADAVEAWLNEHASEPSTQAYSVYKSELEGARRWLPHGEAVIAGLAPYSGEAGEAALAQEIQQDFKRHAEWVERMRVVLRDMQAQIKKHRIDAEMPDGAWQALKAKLTSEKTEYWSNCYSDGSGMWRLKRCLLDYGKPHIGNEPREGLLDTYARNADSLASIPPEIRAALEPKLRWSNVPHRMGGPCDPIQGCTSRDDGDLLFQIASDEAMGWVWADLGTLCVYVNPADLKLRRFGQLNVRLEGG